MTRMLRVFKLKEEAKERGIDWSNFEEDDLETVDILEIPINYLGIPTKDVGDMMIDNGYGDCDIYGARWID